MMYATPLQTTVESLTTFLASLLTWPQVLGLIPLAVAVWWVWKRTQESDDPSGTFALETETGSVSVLVSGAYWIALLVGIAALLMWNVIASTPLFGVGLAAVVGVAWWLEKQEAMD